MKKSNREFSATSPDNILPGILGHINSAGGLASRARFHNVSTPLPILMQMRIRMENQRYTSKTLPPRPPEARRDAGHRILRPWPDLLNVSARMKYSQLSSRRTLHWADDFMPAQEAFPKSLEQRDGP
jgi:hypothetical protein